MTDARELFSEVQETAERSDGYAFRFSAAALGEVERFAWSQRKSWPSVTVEIRLFGEHIWLTITGPEGTRERIDAEILAPALA